MITIRNFGRQIIINYYENDKINDFYGRTKYLIKRPNITNYYGKILYKIEGEWAKDFYGRMLYKLTGNEFREFSGKVILRFEKDSIRDFYGRFLYLVDGYLNDFDKLLLGTLYMEYGSLEDAIK